MTTLEQAIDASAYVSAAAENYDGRTTVIVGAEGDSFTVEIWDEPAGEQIGDDERGLSLETIAHRYPSLNWYPIRSEGAWGDEAEARRAIYDGEPLPETDRAYGMMDGTPYVIYAHETDDHLFAPEVFEVGTARSIYLGGEDDPDNDTPAEAIARGLLLLQRQHEAEAQRNA